MNTNLTMTENIMFTNLPIMSKQFNERISAHISENNLSINGQIYSMFTNRNNQQNMNERFLGYDSLFQFNLIGKLIFFMIFFESNSEKEFRYILWAFVITYYFYNVRDIYV